jgi:hypothetical protein
MKKSALVIVFLCAAVIGRAQAGFGVLYDQTTGFQGKQILADPYHYRIYADRIIEGDSLTRLELEAGLDGNIWSSGTRNYPLQPNTRLAIGQSGDYWFAVSKHTGPQETSLFLYYKSAAGLTISQLTYVLPDVIEIQIDQLVWQEYSGNVFVAGCFRRFDDPKSAKPFLLKATASGTLVWDNLFNTAGKTFWVSHLKALSDGGCAWVHSVDGTDLYVEKFSASGQSLWRRTIGGPLTSVTALAEAADQSIAVALYDSPVPSAGGKTGHLLRIASDGSSMSNLNLNAFLQANAVRPMLIVATAGNDLVIAGNLTGQLSNPEKAFAACFSASGALFWQRSYGFFNGPADWVFGTETPNYGFAFTGSSQNQVFLLVTDNTGNAGSANYCTAVSASPWNEWISAVRIGTIENSSGKSTYSDFTQFVTSGQEDEIPYAVAVNYNWETYDEYLRIWVDLNQDETFDNATDLVVSTKINHPANGLLVAHATGMFTLPGYKKLGNARIRVIVQRESWPDPCGVVPFGEVEDYTMNFNDAIPFHYCPSAASFPWHEWIAGVQLANETHPSDASAYSDFTSGTPVQLTQGQKLSLSLTAGYSWETFDENWSVWIDFNQNGVFEAPEELVFQQQMPRPANGTAFGVLDGIIKVPVSAIPGVTRMRVSMQRGQFADPCSIFVYGEVEDYSVNINIAGPLATDDHSDAALLSLKLYPNPFERMIFIQSESPVTGVRVYRVNGELVAEAGAVMAMDLSQLPVAVYIIAVKTEAGTVIRRIVRADIK